MKSSRRQRSARRHATARVPGRRAAAARRRAAALRAWLARVAAATGRPGDGGGEAQGASDARALPQQTRRGRRRALSAALLRKIFRDQFRPPGPSGAQPNGPSQTKGDR